MKKPIYKVILLTIVVCVSLISGAIYYVSTKLKPEEIKKLTIDQVAKVFPNSSVELGEVDVKIGFNFKIYMSKFRLEYNGSMGGVKSKLTSINELQIKIPFWAILMGGGIVEFKMDNPEINFEEFTEGTNWKLAVGKNILDESKEEQKDNDTTDNVKLELGPLAKSKINIRFNNTIFSYKLKSKTNGKFIVSKFIINGLNFETPSAFELASSVLTTDDLKNTTSFDILTIGQINLSEYLKNGDLPLDAVVKINQFSKSGLTYKVPEISTNINLVAKKSGIIEGVFNSTFETQNKISGKFSIGKSIRLTNFNADIYMKDIQTITSLDSSIDMSKAKFTAMGSFEIDDQSKMVPNFQFELTPAVNTSIDGVEVSTTFNGELKDSTYSLFVANKIMGGSANINVLGSLDLNQTFNMSKISPIDIKVIARDIKLTEKFIQTKLWANKNLTNDNPSESQTGTKNDEKSNTTNQKADNPPILPPMVISLDWSNVNVGGSNFQGKGKIVTSNSAVAIDGLVFKFANGNGKLSQVTSLKKNSNESKFNLEIANLNVESFKSFLPPFIENFKGDFTGKISGETILYKTKPEPKYDVLVDISVKQGEIKKLNISDYVNPVLKNIPVVKTFYTSDKEMKVNGSFETLSLKGKFKESNYQISNFLFWGLNKKVEVSGAGNISPLQSTPSEMDVVFTDHGGKISDLLQKNTGSKTLPLKLKGNGFSLTPDVSYTVSKLAKGAMKTKGEEKLKEAATKALDKAADKILNGKAKDLIKSDETKEKVNKLLKGLFK